MAVLAALGALPLALGGDSVEGNNDAIAIVSIVSIVGGYLLLFALWWFVFRRRRWSSEDPHKAEIEAALADSAALVAEHEAHLAAADHERGSAPAGGLEADPGHVGALHIERRLGPRYPRR